VESFRRCFYDALHEYMRSEAEKGKKMEEQENKAAGKPKPEVPPNSPGPESAVNLERMLKKKKW
jgi:hypothetical protein